MLCVFICNLSTYLGICLCISSRDMKHPWTRNARSREPCRSCVSAGRESRNGPDLLATLTLRNIDAALQQHLIINLHSMSLSLPRILFRAPTSILRPALPRAIPIYPPQKRTMASSSSSLTNIATPERCYVDFCLIPVTSTPAPPPSHSHRTCNY